MRATCSECNDPEYARGLCHKHYQRARYHNELPVPPSRQCRHCGKPFVSKYRNAVYCSRACKDAAQDQRRRADALAACGERQCLECGMPIATSVTLKAKCCSRECGVKWQRRKLSAERRARVLANRKPCARCGGEIPPSRSGAAIYCSWECKHLANSATWRQRSPHYMRQYLYGLTAEQYQALLDSQSGVCAVCGTDDWNGKTKSPHVDHDHNCCPGDRSCGSCVRGLLCGNCNNGLGYFGDDPVRLRAAAHYLERFAT